MSARAGHGTRPSGVERWVPGVRLVRHYQRRWLAPDLVAGLVLAAILVPQGMAYAELAGLPAVTGLYTTVACLIGYAIFGPSRVLVLGPDSSVVPDDPGGHRPARHRRRPDVAPSCWPGCSRSMVGLIEIGLGLGKLGFVADLLSSEVQVGYLNGLAVTIIVGPAPEALRLLRRRRRLLRRVRGFVENLDETVWQALAIGVGRAGSCCSCCPASPAGCPAVLVAVVGATVVSAVFGLADRGCRHRRRAPPGHPPPVAAVDLVQRRRAAPARRRGHHPREPHRHHRHGLELRGPPRRRGRPQPGDGRRWARPTSPPGSSRASPSRPARRAPPSPSRRAPRASSPASSAPASWSCCCSS